MTSREAERYAIVAVPTRDVLCWWVEIWEISSRTAAIELTQDLLDGGYARAAVVQGRGTPDAPTPSGELQVYQAVAGGYRPDAFFPLVSAERIDVRPNLLPHWRPLLVAVPRDRAAHPQEIAAKVTWRRSYSQMCHALRRMRDDGLLISPVRGHFQRTPANSAGGASPTAA